MSNNVSDMLFVFSTLIPLMLPVAGVIVTACVPAVPPVSDNVMMFRLPLALGMFTVCAPA